MEVEERSLEEKNVACKLIKIIGTVERHRFAQYDFTAPTSSGYPLFCRNKLLDIMQIKRYFGQQIPKLKQALRRIEGEEEKGDHNQLGSRCR